MNAADSVRHRAAPKASREVRKLEKSKYPTSPLMKRLQQLGDAERVVPFAAVRPAFCLMSVEPLTDQFQKRHLPSPFPVPFALGTSSKRVSHCQQTR